MRTQQIGSWPPAVFPPPHKVDASRRPRDDGKRRRTFSDHTQSPAETGADADNGGEDGAHKGIDITV